MYRKHANWMSSAQVWVAQCMLKLLLAVLVFSFNSATPASAALCTSNNPRACSEPFICAVATKISENSGKRTWMTTREYYGAFVREAKRRGLTCGVKPKKSYAQICKLTAAQVKKAQTHLKELDLYPYKIDGVVGKGTLAAIKKAKGIIGDTVSTGQCITAKDIKEFGKFAAARNTLPDTRKLTPTAPIAKGSAQSNEMISVSSGSGFAISEDGHVITNNHVIDGCQKVTVHTNGTAIPVRVVSYDPQNDLALLKGDFRPSTVFALTDDRPELLQDVYVAGFPFGNKISSSVKVTKGIISSLTGIGNNYSNIQIDAALQSGNSGGPILDELGNLVGVAVSKLDAKYMFENFGSIPENTNFGIKSNIVRSIIDSHDVNKAMANTEAIGKSKLGKMISDGTYYISCWMTMAQVKQLRTKKVMFKSLQD